MSTPEGSPAYSTSDILADPDASYLSKLYSDSFLVSDLRASLMTGTTNDNNTTFIFGYTTKYLAGFWLGETGKIRYAQEIDTILVMTGWLADAEAGKIVTERTNPASLQKLPATVTASSNL